MTVAWWTALHAQGITHEELDKFRSDEHAWVLLQDEPAIDHNKEQDEKIGYLTGRQERVFERLSTLENHDGEREREIGDQKKNMELLSNLLEKQHK